jgi:hypothetical protein
LIAVAALYAFHQVEEWANAALASGPRLRRGI